MEAQFVANTGAIALSASATKSLWLEVPIVKATMWQQEVSFDASGAETAVRVDLYAVTLNATNPSGGVAGTTTVFNKWPFGDPSLQAPSNTLLTALSTEPSANTFTVASCTITSGSPYVTTSGNFITSGVTAGQTVTGTDVPGSTTVLYVISATQLVMSANASATPGAETLTFQPNLTILRSGYVQPLGGTDPTPQWPLGREILMPAINNNIDAYRFGVRAVTPTGTSPNCQVTLYETE